MQTIYQIFLSQPSLSNQIIQLERELGIPLFERCHKRVRPTPAGEVFVREAELILQNMSRLKNLMEEYAEQTRGSLRLGALSIMCSLVSKEMGVTFCSGETAAYYHHDNVRLLSFSPPIRRTIYFVYRKNPEYYPILRLFLQELDSLVPSKSL